MGKWRFPSNDFGENKGINDSGVSMFRGTPLSSLAREICQNSLDAARGEKVVVEFDLFDVSPAKIPGATTLLDAFKKCLDFWGSQKAETTKDFFTDAISNLKNEKISILRISDFNTTGLTGSRENINTDWTNLTKSSGASDKKATAGGSFGIGKFAPFACSYFSTVFYSTYDINKLSAYQGVSRLVTFTRNDGENTQGIGYFGNEQNTPVYEQLSLDSNFKRSDTEYGTDIYVLGYKFIENWKKNIIISILDGFLGAIWMSKLEIKIAGETLSAESLENYIDKYGDELFGHTKYYYSALVSEDTKWYTENFLGLGEIKLGLLLGEKEFPNRICMMRKTGMKIMDKDRLATHAPIVGVMLINGEEINKELRKMENPEHTKWEPGRTQNPHKSKQLLSSINDLIRKKIEEVVSTGDHESVDASGVGSYLPDVAEDSTNQNPEETICDKIFETEIKKVKKRNPFHDTDARIKNRYSSKNETLIEDVEFGEEEGAFDYGSGIMQWEHEGKRDHQEDKNPGEERQLGDGRQSKIKKIKEVMLDKFVTICVDKNKGKYAMSIIPSITSRNGYVELYLSAETQNYKAPIIDVSFMNQKIHFNQNVISGLEFKKGEQIRLSVQLDYYEYCSMEVKVYASEE